MIEPVAKFQNDTDNPTRTAEIHFLEGSQQYIVRMYNDLGHTYKAYFHKDDLEKAKSFAKDWVEQ